MYIKNVLILCAVIVLSVAACGQETKETKDTKAGGAAGVSPSAMESGPLPEGHPTIEGGGGGMGAGGQQASVDHSTISVPKAVKISDEVKAKWNEVEIEVVDSSSKATSTLKISVGEKAAVKDTGFSFKVEAFAPDYAMFDDHIGSRTADLRNPAVLVELFEGDKSIARGWVFQLFRNFNSYKHERFEVALKSPAVEVK